MINRFINFCFFLITLLCIYSSIRVYKSYRQQFYVLADFNNPTAQIRPDEYVNKIESDYPNLSLTSIPLKAIQANYYLYNDSIQKGLDLINKVIAERSNPYIMFPEATKAKLYFSMKLLDSSSYYAKKAFSALPKNPFHFAELARNLAYEEKIDSITYYFNKIKDNYDSQVWKVYLASMATYKDRLEDPNYPEQIAKEALNTPGFGEDIRVSSLFVLYGLETTNKSFKLEREGLNFFNNNEYEKALTKFLEAQELTPINIVNKENLAITYFNLKDWLSTLNILKEIENSGHLLDQYQNFMYALTLINLEQIELGCQKFDLSYKQGYTQARETMLLFNCATN